jgi:anti-anti-sigma factor
VPFVVQPAQFGGHQVLHIQGELDTVTAPVLERAVAGAVEASPPLLVLDLTPTTFLDSSGARQVARSAREAMRAGTAARVVCPKGNRTVRLVIDPLELHTLVPVQDSIDEVDVEPRP